MVLKVEEAALLLTRNSILMWYDGILCAVSQEQRGWFWLILLISKTPCRVYEFVSISQSRFQQFQGLQVEESEVESLCRACIAETSLAYHVMTNQKGPFRVKPVAGAECRGLVPLEQLYIED